jgi:hypothetical protein
MAIASWAAEALLALTGALRLARGDANGLAYFDASEQGFWQSFRAGALCYPLYLILLAFPVEIATEIGTPEQIDPVRQLVVETIHYVISWVAFPLLMLPLVDRLQRGSRFFGFMVAYNWCQLPQMVVFTIVALAGATSLLPGEGVLIADIVVGIAALVYEWYIARVALAVSRSQAVLVIVVDIALATLLTHLSTALY